MSVLPDVRQAGTFTAAATSISWTMTISSGLSNLILMVGATVAAATLPTITGINWDDGGTPQALTQKGHVVEGSGSGAADLWYVLSPVPGASKTIKINISVTGEITGEGASYQNVDQNTPFNAASPQTSTGTA